MHQYIIHSGAAPTSAALVKISTGTAIKTILQVKAIAASQFRILEWGISFYGSAAATPIACELLSTGTVAATVTAHVAAGLPGYERPSVPTPSTFFTLGTGATGYNATAEGTVTASRLFDGQGIAPTNQYVKQFPLGNQPIVTAGDYLRIRTTAGAAVDCQAYVIVEV